jgi:NAD-reducing hydrogenase small subunit
MSFLDQDERLLDLAQKIELVHSPLADVKEFPPDVAITLIEGAVANEDQKTMLQTVRSRTMLLVALGDCAVTGNVTALRNGWPHSDQAILNRAYQDPANINPQIPTQVPKLFIHAHPLHEIVKVDYYIPGCPPSADLINNILNELLAGKTPTMEGNSKFG